MIKADNIIKSFQQIDVLKGVNLEVKKGEIISLVGSSGAGKSTLLQILGTLDRSYQGNVIINGFNIAKLKQKEMADFRNKYIGFIFQFHHLLPEFTAIENTCIPGLIAKRQKKEVEEYANELLSFLGLGNRKDHKPNQLSGGEQQRVAIARSLINRPSVVFADEPSGNLDSNNSDELHKLFFSLREKFDQTFFIATHNKELAQIADRKLTIKDGILL